jgi:hypothetical protein
MLSLEWSSPKAFGGAVHNARFLRRFWAPSNITKYDSKINSSIWLEDYHLAYRAGGANDDLFIFQFLPIYLAESTRAWLDHLPRNAINRWDDLWEVFTSNFQGTYVRPGNPWDLRGTSRRRASPSGTTSGVSPRSAMHSQVWQTPMSFRPSRMALCAAP